MSKINPMKIPMLNTIKIPNINPMVNSTIRPTVKPMAKPVTDPIEKPELKVAINSEKKPEIKIFKPIIAKNKITYPIMFIDENIKIVNEYLTDEKLDISNSVEGLIATYASIAMANNIPIISEVPIDKTFYSNIMKLPEIFYKYDHYLQKLNGGTFNLNIIAPLIDKKPHDKNQKRCASSMSGGVDSLYTLVKKNQEITDLYYVIGYDIDERKSNQNWIKEVINLNKTIAKKYKKNLIICRSNILKHIKSIKSENVLAKCWETYTMSGGLCSIFYPLGFGKLIISGDGMSINKKSKDNINRLFSGIFYDYLFSSPIITIEHFDCNRWEKILELSKSDPSLIYNLRFCVKYNAKGGLNCGKCNKCIMTYLMIYLLGLNKLIKNPIINDSNYVDMINAYIVNKDIYDYGPQIIHLLANFDINKKTTILK